MAPRKSLIINGRKNDDLAVGGFSAGLLDPDFESCIKSGKIRRFAAGAELVAAELETAR